MSHSNLEHIRDITEAFCISNQKQLLLKGKPVTIAEDDTYIKEPSNKMLFDQLQKIIYNEFYVQPCEQLSNEAPTAEEIKANIKALRNANNSKESFDEGWQLQQQQEESDILFAEKGNDIVQLKPGEYLNEYAGRNSTQRKVKLYRPSELAGEHEAFYFAYGNAVTNTDDDFIARFYFNSGFEGNVKLMELFTEFLNPFSVPFIFKCLVHPHFYNRSDTSVLYLNKQFVNFVFEYISSIYADIKPEVRDSLPLFVLQLGMGIGFAEQPPSINESFGTHWSKMIAAGIMKAYEAGVEHTHWLHEVLKHIQQHHGYTDHQLYYKNPNSHYPYSFASL
jgi:HopA1 effector protein family